MRLIAKNYKEIEENPNNDFANNIMYVNNVSLIGFGARRISGTNCYGNIFLDVAVRLDDNRSIFKLVFMYEVDKTEYDRFSKPAYTMPDRGITGYCPVLVVASSTFVKDKDEYYIYCVNGRDDEDNKIYSLSFDIISVIKLQYLEKLVKNCVYHGAEINYTKSDYYEPLHMENTTVLNLAFTNQFSIIGFVVPPKKIFESRFKCLTLAKFTHNRNVYYIYFNVFFESKDRKNLKEPTHGSTDALFNQVDRDKSYIIHENIDVVYHSKGAAQTTNKVVTFATRRDNNETLAFIFPQDNYEQLYHTAVQSILK